MSAAQNFCTQQIRRCSGLDLFNTLDKIALKELLRALLSAAEDDAHAERIVDQWLKSNPKRPTPADIWRVAAETATPEMVPRGCDVCKSEPFVVAVDGLYDYGSGEESRYSFQRCTCARGQYLLAKDKTREAEGVRGV